MSVSNSFVELKAEDFWMYVGDDDSEPDLCCECGQRIERRDMVAVIVDDEARQPSMPLVHLGCWSEYMERHDERQS